MIILLLEPANIFGSRLLLGQRKNDFHNKIIPEVKEEQQQNSVTEQQREIVTEQQEIIIEQQQTVTKEQKVEYSPEKEKHIKRPKKRKR